MRRILFFLVLLFPCLAWADALEEEAMKGNAEAQVELGSRHAEGRTPNLELAAQWYGKAAEQGNADGQVLLAILYESGQGVAKNLEKAIFWYGKAAEQGHGEAQYYLGMMSAYGSGMAKDFVQACKWLELAAAKEDERAVRARDALVKLMTPQQIIEARKLAREFKPR